MSHSSFIVYRFFKCICKGYNAYSKIWAAILGQEISLFSFGYSKLAHFAVTTAIACCELYCKAFLCRFEDFTLSVEVVRHSMVAL